MKPNKEAKQRRVSGYQTMQNFNLPGPECMPEEEPEDELWYGQGSNDEAVAGETKGGQAAGHRPIRAAEPSQTEPKPSQRAPGFHTPQGVVSFEACTSEWRKSRREQLVKFRDQVNCYNRNHGTKFTDKQFEKMAKEIRFKIFNRVNKEIDINEMKRIGRSQYNKLCYRNEQTEKKQKQERVQADVAN